MCTIFSIFLLAWLLKKGNYAKNIRLKKSDKRSDFNCVMAKAIRGVGSASTL